MGKHYTEATKKAALELIESGMKIKDVAKKMRIPPGTIACWNHRQNKPVSSRKWKSIRMYDDEIKAKARALHFDNNWSVNRISAALNVPQGTIYDWINPKRCARTYANRVATKEKEGFFKSLFKRKEEVHVASREDLIKLKEEIKDLNSKMNKILGAMGISWMKE